ncbi:MAG TPA: Fic family protein [Deltaproteobacteria bacterium]|nr:Fic family protein [Deltaproteobacteria bacterium]
MYNNPAQMEPQFPPGTPDLEDMAREVVSRSAALGGQLHPVAYQAVIELLRLINSYYSNLIEGHSTHPIDIERAMHKDYSADPVKRDLQMESLAHINCQKQIEVRLLAEPGLNTASEDFIKWLHRILYDQLPGELRQVKDDRTGEVLKVVPGQPRQREVEVGFHVGPAASSITKFLKRFTEAYSPDMHHGIAPLIATAASHHRLMWIHPFLDGNGRVTRLYTDACFQRLPLPGYGLWNVSRGLARRRDEYMAALSWADAPRRNDYDGRGNLSNEGLLRFCRFFLETCLDQISFMHGLLKLDGLLERIQGYVHMRHAKLIPAPKAELPILKLEAAFMLQEALLRGQVSRGDIIRYSGMGERSGRQLLGQLLAEGLLVSDSPKGAVRLSFPTHVASYLFPELYPAQFV